MNSPAKPLAAALLVLSTAVSTGGWYMATHRGEQRHFDSCREQTDGKVILGYEYGAGDKVTASVDPTQSAFVVSLLVESDASVHPALALHGELRVDSFGGLRGRPVKHADGTVLSCTKAA
jgi:hypothetical protein